MPGWVEQHTPPIRRWLLGCSVRPQSKRLGLRHVQIVHRKIKVHLLRGVAVGPGRRRVVRHANRGQPHPVSLDRDELVAAERDLPADELSPESRENGRVSAVQCHGRQTGYSHRRDRIGRRTDVA